MAKRTERTTRTHRRLKSPWQEWERFSRDEKYWENHVERGLLKAEYLHDFVLRLWFEENLGVAIYELDFRPLIVDANPGGVFRAIANVERFQYVVGDYALIWPNPETGAYDEGAVDLAPECVRFFCERYGKRVQQNDNLVIPNHAR